MSLTVLYRAFRKSLSSPPHRRKGGNGEKPNCRKAWNRYPVTWYKLFPDQLPWQWFHRVTRQRSLY
jgi:hypothetical protein